MRAIRSDEPSILCVQALAHGLFRGLAMKSLYISAAHKSAGKTQLSIGLAAALRARGFAVAPFKKGPDYIDTAWLALAAGNSCRNLDFFTMERDEIHASFAAGLGADFALIEGTKGLHDGVAADGTDSNAELASLLDVPVLLVLDTRGITRGIASLVQGLVGFDTRVAVAGVVLNRTGGERHVAKLRSALETYTDVTVVGAMPECNALIEEQHLGLVPERAHSHPSTHIDRLRNLVENHVDVSALVPRTKKEPVQVRTRRQDQAGRLLRPRIGIPRDQAFCFYYDADLEQLEAAGAQLMFFDALQSPSLPEVDALFFGGGFPESSMQELHDNQTLRAAVRQFAESGRPIYAECGGLMYLARSLTWKGLCLDMCGVLPLDIQMHARPQGRGYVKLKQTGAAPWGAINGLESELKAHEFHYSSVHNSDPDLRFAYTVKRGHGVDGCRDGIVWNNVFASYAHLRHTRGSPWTDAMLRWVRSSPAFQGRQATARAS